MSQSIYTFTEGEAIIADLEFGVELTRVPLTEGPQMALMQYSASGATTADSGTTVTASYTGADIGGIPQKGMMTFSLTAGTAGTGAAVMIANPNGLSTVANITGQSLHLTFADTYCNVGYFVGTVLTNAQYLYTRNITCDGATKYRAGFTLSAGAIDVHLPDGRTVTVTNAAYYNNAGRYCQFESFTNAALGIRATFYAVTFEDLV